MSQLCSTCGYQNPADSTFCIRCGSNVGIAQASQQLFLSAPLQPASVAGSTGSLGNAEYHSSTAQGYQAQSMMAFSSDPVQMELSSKVPDYCLWIDEDNEEQYLLNIWGVNLPMSFCHGASVLDSPMDQPQIFEMMPRENIRCHHMMRQGM